MRSPCELAHQRNKSANTNGVVLPGFHLPTPTPSVYVFRTAAVPCSSLDCRAFVNLWFFGGVNCMLGERLQVGQFEGSMRCLAFRCRNCDPLVPAYSAKDLSELSYRILVGRIGNPSYIQFGKLLFYSA